jgi:hypothetical protein
MAVQQQEKSKSAWLVFILGGMLGIATLGVLILMGATMIYTVARQSGGAWHILVLP